jgi:hypothetical protein
MSHILPALLGLCVLLAFAVPSARAANITSIASGNWSATSTWSTGAAPTGADNVTIANGHTVTIDVTLAACQSLTVGQGVSGVLQFSTTTARTLTVGGDVTIAAGGTFQSATSGTVTTHMLSLSGNLTNNGTLDFSTNGNAAGAGITFTGATSNAFSGTGGTTDIRTLTISKGTSSANVLELSTSAFTVQGSSTDVAASAFLTLTNGTFKISGTFTGSHRTFTSASYTIGSTAGFWLNNPNYTVAGQANSSTNSGLLRLTQGTFNVGSASGTAMGATPGAVFTIEGGTLNLAGRLSTSNAVTYTQTGGTVNVTTIGNSTNNQGGFDLNSSSNTISVSGGSIVLVRGSTASSKRDYNVNGTTVSITGGTLQVGSSATPSGNTSVFSISGPMPNVVVDNTTTTKTAQLFAGAAASSALTVSINTGSTLDLAARTLTVTGATVTNNGTLSGTGPGSTLAFASETLAQTYTGSGVTSSPLDGLTLDSPSGLTLGNTTNIVTMNARLLRGTVTNSNKLTLGTGGSSAVQTVIGKTSLLTAGGSFDAAPTFNLGSGAYGVSYQPEGGSRPTGFEIPASGSVTNLTVNNANGVTLSGGNLTVTGTLTLSSGNITTGASTLVISSTGTVSRTSGHIVGNLRKNVATGSAVSRTFEIGTGSDYTPATVLFTSVSAGGNLTATTTAGDHPNLNGSAIDPTHSVNRYWTMTNSGVAFTNYGITLNFVPADIDAGSSPAAFLVRKYDAPNWSAPTIGTRTSTSTQATGMTSFSDFAVGEVTHTITASSGANGAISPSGAVVVAEGANQAFTFAPDACYRVADVVVDGVSVGTPTSYTFLNVVADHTIAVSFANDFPITASAGAHGSIAPSGTTFVTCGADQSYTITPDVDYIVGDVLVDGVSVGAVTSYTFTSVAGPHSIAASFVIENNPPVLSNVPASATIPELAPYTFTATATDVESPPEVLTFSLLGAPAGAAIDPSTGVFTWTPGEAQGPGVYPFTVRVGDGQWNTDAAITLTVTEVNEAPIVTGVPAAATIPELDPSTFTANATDSDLPAQTLTFSLVGAPSGASIDASTGVFAWTPTEAQGPGTYPFTVRVTDGIANTDIPVTLTVTEVNVAPTLSNLPHGATIPQLTPYAFTAAAADPDLPAQTLSFSLVGAPAGAAIDPGTGAFAWTPAASQTGPNTFDVRVSDGVANTDSTITITVTVTPIGGLVAAQVKSGNDPGLTTKIQLDWPAVPSGQTVEVFRAGFGGYPRYDDDGGHVPSAPSYPPPGPWTLTDVTAPGTMDQPPARDFYYYVAFVHGAGGAVSSASNMTAGTLGYFLGDVSDGSTPGQGDNAVNTVDLSLLGAHYGIEGVEAAAYPYLDVGPTTDYSTDALPTTDGVIDFEDLIVFAINIDAVSAPALVPRARPANGGPRSPVPAAAGNALSVEAGSAAKVGEAIACPITLNATGQVKGLSVRLSWNPAKVRPTSVTPGPGIAEAGGLVLSPRPGTVDVAFVGLRPFSGTGVLATVSFTTLAVGDPEIRVETVDARDAENGKLVLPVEVNAPPVIVPRATRLGLPTPNPFSRSAAIAFDLAQAGRVELEIYSVDGRRVRTLAGGPREPGAYNVVWDGRDEDGRSVPAGLYYVRFAAGSSRFTRQVVVLR